MESPNEQASPDTAPPAVEAPIDPPEVTRDFSETPQPVRDFDGNNVIAVVVPAPHITRLHELASAIRQYVGAGAHHLVTELEELAQELASHL